jgi:hypothetical protein
LELFQTILTISRKSWFIIDRGATSSFVPVWEIMDQLYPVDTTMHEIADFLKRAWLTDASSCALSEALLCEIDRVRLLQPTPIIYLQSSLARPTKASTSVLNLVDQLKNQLKEHINAMNINYDKMTDDELLNKVRFYYL